MKIVEFKPVAVTPIHLVGAGIAIPIAVVGIYYGYRAYKAIKGAVNTAMAPLNAAQNAANSIVKAIPIKGFDGINELTGLM